MCPPSRTGDSHNSETGVPPSQTVRASPPRNGKLTSQRRNVVAPTASSIQEADKSHKRKSSPRSTRPPHVEQKINYLPIPTRSKYINASIDYLSVATLSRPSSLQSHSQPIIGPWSIGDFIWLRLNRFGDIANDAGPGVAEGYWWPGKVEGSSLGAVPMRIRLYGDDGHGPRVVSVSTPSDRTLLSFRSPVTHIARFNTFNFTHPSAQIAATQGMLTDLQLRFKTALEEISQADADENDGLPDPSFMFRSQLSPKMVAQEIKSTSDSPVLLANQGFDEELTVPGELVLARAKQAATHYWPAKVIKWIPPSQSQRRGRYQLLFFDRETSVVDRKLFYTMFEPEFRTCLVNLPKIHTFLNDETSVADEEVTYEQSRDTFRSIPKLNLPVPPTDFLGIPVPEQFRYITPILTLIINGEYPPARDRHQKFIKGGKYRTALLQESFMRGNLSNTQVVEIADELRKWALRDERHAIHLPSEVGISRTMLGARTMDRYTDRMDRSPTPEYKSPANQVTTRPIGGIDYELLSGTERSQYCVDVLLPEAIIQYHLWQGKHHTSLDPAEGEEVLHQLGLELMEQDGPDAWIHTIVTVRETCGTTSDKEQEKSRSKAHGTRTG